MPSIDIQESVAVPGLLGWTYVNTLIRRLIRLSKTDRAVMYAVGAKMWGMLSAPVTLLLIASFFSQELQGYYYTFRNILALQVFVELGLGTVLIQFAAHEWSKLHLDENGALAGDPDALSRLASLGRLALKWFSVGSVLFVVLLSVGGYLFFSRPDYPDVRWAAPWLLLCLLCAANLCLLPVWSLLEGCNQVSSVYGFRLTQGVLQNIAIWASILLGAQLWTPAIALAVGLAWSTVYLGLRQVPFLRAFFSSIRDGRIGWRLEVWPMQWRIAMSWLGGYFVFSLFTPVLFHYHGPVVAGQMGMTWAIVTAVAVIAGAWSKTKAPRFGMLVAKKQYPELDRLFFQILWVSFVVLLAGAAVLWLVVYILNVTDCWIANRFLPPLPTGLFLLGHVIMHTTFPFSVYLRAHKREPYLALSVISAILVGLSTFVLGGRYGPMGMAVGYLAVAVLFTLPGALVVWHRCRTAWHSDPIGV